MTEIERRCWREIEDEENLKRDCEYIRRIKEDIKQTSQKCIEDDYFEFLKTIDVSNFLIESIKLLRMFTDFLMNRA